MKLTKDEMKVLRACGTEPGITRKLVNEICLTKLELVRILEKLEQEGLVYKEKEKFADFEDYFWALTVEGEKILENDTLGIDVINLRKTLIEFYNDYFKDKSNPAIRKYAETVYLQYMGSVAVLDKDTAYALNILCDIGIDTGIPPKSDSEIKKLIKKLEKLTKKTSKKKG